MTSDFLMPAQCEIKRGCEPTLLGATVSPLKNAADARVLGLEIWPGGAGILQDGTLNPKPPPSS